LKAAGEYSWYSQVLEGNGSEHVGYRPSTKGKGKRGEGRRQEGESGRRRVKEGKELRKRRRNGGKGKRRGEIDYGPSFRSWIRQ